MSYLREAFIMPVGVYKRLSGPQMKNRLEIIKTAQRMSFKQKKEYATKIINSVFPEGKPVAVMFSGGRDSCAVAILARKYKPTLLYCDTGLATDYAQERVKIVAGRLNLPLVVLSPETDAFTMWRTFGHYPIGPKRGHTYLKQKTGINTSPVQCCYQLKEKPLKKYISEFKPYVILWGNRATDSNRRKLGIADHGVVAAPSVKWPCYSIQPVALFLDSDIEKMVAGFGLKFDEKAESGCQVCCTDLSRRDNQLTRCFISNRLFFNKAILSGLGSQILKARGEPCGEDAVKDTLETCPQKFLRIPKIGKKQQDNGRSKAHMSLGGL